MTKKLQWAVKSRMRQVQQDALQQNSVNSQQKQVTPSIKELKNLINWVPLKIHITIFFLQHLATPDNSGIIWMLVFPRGISG